jgi:hypothetical protein
MGRGSERRAWTGRCGTGVSRTVRERRRSGEADSRESVGSAHRGRRYRGFLDAAARADRGAERRRSRGRRTRIPSGRLRAGIELRAADGIRASRPDRARRGGRVPQEALHTRQRHAGARGRLRRGRNGLRHRNRGCGVGRRRRARRGDPAAPGPGQAKRCFVGRTRRPRKVLFRGGPDDRGKRRGRRSRGRRRATVGGAHGDSESRGAAVVGAEPPDRERAPAASPADRADSGIGKSGLGGGGAPSGGRARTKVRTGERHRRGGRASQARCVVPPGNGPGPHGADCSHRSLSTAFRRTSSSGIRWRYAR